MASARESATRYEILFKLASGGMATVYVGAARGAMGFRQIVAIKEPHPHLLDDKEYRRELIAEARLASMIHHANVVDVRDVEASSRTIRLVMDYIEGASFGELIVLASKDGGRLPPSIVLRVALDACAGLHAAHELIDEKGRKVGLVHRDVSPQNILVGLDGATRVSDFGVAKATAASVTSSGTLKGKVAYMAPEYLEGKGIDRRADVFGLGVVVWEALCGQRLFRGKSEAETVKRVLTHDAPLLSQQVPELGPHFDAALATALAKQPEERFATAAAFGAALEASAKRAVGIATQSEVAALVAQLAGPLVETRRLQLRARLAQEPGLLSLMGAPPPSLPASRDSAPAPSTKPEHPQDNAPTLIDAPAIDLPEQAPAAVAHTAEPIVKEVSDKLGDIEAAGVPKQRSVFVYVALAMFLGVLVVGGVFASMHKNASGTEATSTAASASTSTVTVGSTVASTRPVSSITSAAESVAPLATLSPLATSVASHAKVTPKPTASAAIHAPDGPPPNPY